MMEPGHVIVNAESAETFGKSGLYLPWKPTGRKVTDGINDDFVFDDVETAGSTIGFNGKFVVRCDQHTHVSALSDNIAIEWKTDTNHYNIPLEAGKNIIIPAGTPFSVMVHDDSHVAILNRRTFGLGNLPPQKPQDVHLRPELGDAKIPIVDKSETGAVLLTCRENNVAIGVDGEEVPVVDFAPFPGATTSTVKEVGILENRFIMEWKDCDGLTQVHFHGTGGVLKGGKGTPGVVLIDNKEIRITVLQKRVDGSFYLEADADFMMITCESLPNGEPDETTLKAAVYPKSGVKLPIGFWHTVPFPVVGENKRVEFVELVAKTNANCVASLKDELAKQLHVFL